MKRILLFVAVLLFATAAFAGGVDRDVLITADGDVYSISAESIEKSENTKLVLSVQRDGETTRSVVPESIDNGVNVRPTLAYDAESKTLLVVWMHMPDATSSELLVASYSNNEWRPAMAIDSKRAQRFNLSVGITHRLQTAVRDGSFEDRPALVLHAAWWEKDGAVEGARYAVMGIAGGRVYEPEIHDMSTFVASGDAKANVDDKQFNTDFLRHVAVLPGPAANAVDVVFAEPKTQSFYRATLVPRLEVRIHIPVGARPGAPPKLGGPKAFSADWSGRTGTITSADGKTVIFTSETADKLTYITLHNGEWSAIKQFSLKDISAESAMAALAKLAATATE